MVVANVALAMSTKDMLMKQGPIPADMTSIAMLDGGTLVNALAFSGSNWLFSMLKISGLDEERKCHDKAAKQIQAAQLSKTD